MLKSPSETLTLSKIYDIPPEDILFLDFSLVGVKLNFFYPRVRFEFIPENKSYFKTSFQRAIKKYFFALPTNSTSNYYIKDRYLMRGNERFGRIKNLANDTCDTSYPRRNGTVLNLNPVPKSSCHGCQFCHTLLQGANDRQEDLRSVSGVKNFIEKWLRKNKVLDLSHLIQVAVVTGCFGGEEKVIEYLQKLDNILSKYSFDGELFYYGSEITTKESFDRLKKIKHFAVCLSLECFENREKLVRDIKAKITIDKAKEILKIAKESGFRTNFSYILGLESIEIIEKRFKELFPYINSFPVINIFQVHRSQEKLRYSEAWKLDYYMKVRKIIEDLFKNTEMRPRVWENYRSLWYLNFAGEELTDIRTP